MPSRVGSKFDEFLMDLNINKMSNNIIYNKPIIELLELAFYSGIKAQIQADYGKDIQYIDNRIDSIMNEE